MVRPLGVPPPPGLLPKPKEPIPKKQKVEANLIPEDQFLAQHKVLI
jgi:hypothetical protein